MSEKCPQKIIIMADYSADAYAWDFKTGEMITPLQDYFPDNPQISVIEEDLLKWCEWFDRDVDPFEENIQFPWQDFHKQGMALAKQLGKVLSQYDIEVYYQLPFEDPNGKDSKPVKVVI